MAGVVAASIGAIAAVSIVTHARGALAQPAASAADYVFVDGFDAAIDCSPSLACAAPAAGKTCISGRLIDAGSGVQLRASFYPGKTCSDGAAGGPCELSITAYDAVDYASNPTGATPLASIEKTLDGCGRFRFANLDPSPFGGVAIVTDDAPASPSGDAHVSSAVTRNLAPNTSVDAVNAVATTRDTVAAWTQSAGNPFGSFSFADVGVILFGFEVGTVPRAGVTVTRNGSAAASSDFYFSDASSLQRLQVDPALAATGINGAALFAGAVGSSSYSGAGAEPVGCTWPLVMATSIAGAVLFVEFNLDCQP
jgi:hypothetical protein